MRTSAPRRLSCGRLRLRTLLCFAVFLASVCHSTAEDVALLTEVRKRLLDRYDSIAKAYVQLDATALNEAAVKDSRPLSEEEFTRGLQVLPKPFSGEEAKKLFLRIDADSSGRVTAGEFFKAMRVGEQGMQTVSLLDFLHAARDEAGFEWAGWESTAFQMLDRDDDGKSTPEEFRRTTGQFKTPVTADQAGGLFYQLDQNHDGNVARHEFASAVSKHKEHMKRAWKLEEYKQRIEHLTDVAAVAITVSNVDLARLTPFEQTDVKRIVVLHLADAAGIATDAVRDLEGRKASATLSALGAATGRRLHAGADARPDLLVEAVLQLKPGEQEPEQVLAAVRDKRTRLARDLSIIPGIHGAHGGDIAPADLSLAPLKSAVPTFVASDRDGDGKLSIDEFSAMAAKLQEPPDEAQVNLAFGGLDGDHDAKLNRSEFLGRHVSHFGPANFMGREISVGDFTARLLKRFHSPQDAYDAMQGDPVTADAFKTAVSSFAPPLTDDQADFAFRGMDVDGDGLVVNTEFLAVLKFGQFYPSVDQLQKMFLSLRPASPPGSWSTVFEATQEGQDAIGLRLAGVFLSSYLARTLFLALNLPGGLGAALAAGLLSLLDLLPAAAATEPLRQLVSFLMLFSAGFGLSLRDLRPDVLLMGTLPVTFEAAAVAGCCRALAGLPLPDALAVGGAVAGLGEGFVSARMHQLGRRFAGASGLPRFVATWAPAETCWGLALACAAARAARVQGGAGGGDGGAEMLGAATRLCGSAALGGVLGFSAGKLVSLRSKAVLFGRHVFTGSGQEAALLAAAAAWAAYGVGGLRHVSSALGFAPQDVIQPEAFAIVTGAVLAVGLSPRDLEGVDGAVGGLWTVGQLALFAGLGPGLLDPGTLVQLPMVLPMMVVGLVARLAGVIVANVLAVGCAECGCERCRAAKTESLSVSTGFCFLASLPRTSMQAFFGATAGMHGSAVGGAQTVDMVLLSTRLYFLVLSVLGTALLDWFGPALLDRDTPRCDGARAREQDLLGAGWTSRQQVLSGSADSIPHKFFRLGLVSEDGSVIDHPDFPAFPAKQAVSVLAKAYLVDADALASSIGPSSTIAQFEDVFDSKLSAPYASIRSLPSYGGTEIQHQPFQQQQTQQSYASLGTMPGTQQGSGPLIRRLDHLCPLPALAQLEAADTVPLHAPEQLSEEEIRSKVRL